MDVELAARQLIRALRGSRSQVAMSRRLKAKSNVAYTWESGRRHPTAAGFFHAAARLGVDVPGRMEEFLGNPPDALVGADWSEPATVARFLEHLREGTTVVEVARRVGAGRVSVGRWLKGQAEPRLPDFLRLVDAMSLRLLDFVAVFASPDELPALRDAWQVLEAQRRVAYELPWSHAVLRVLELSAYQRLAKHERGFVARRLGISVEEEERCLLALRDSKLIARRGGRWVATQVLTVDTRKTPEAGRRLKEHWAEVGLRRLPHLEPREEDLFSYNLFAVSEADWDRLRELHIAYFLELRRIVEASQPSERIALVNVQLMRLDEPLGDS